MIPRINSRGYSFKGVTAYLMHDKKADTAERVEWTQTGNMYTDDIQKASKIMAWTDMNSDQIKRHAGGSRAGRKAETGAAYHYSLSWANGKTPDREHQEQMANATLERLGLTDHQYYYVAHNDTKHSHVHIVVNLTHPETGKRAELPLDKNKLQAWALEYEREHGMYCLRREENAIKRGKGEHTKYRGQKKEYATQVTRAYHASDNGKSFNNALEQEGLYLAKGNRNTLVIVDSKGDIQRLMRQLDTDERGQAKTIAVQAKLKDLNIDKLPEANQLSLAVKEQNSLYDRDAAEVEQQKKFIDGAHNASLEKIQVEKKEADKKQIEEQAARNDFKWKLSEILRSIKKTYINWAGRTLKSSNLLSELHSREENEERTALAKSEIDRKWKGNFDERINNLREKHDLDGSEERLQEAREQFSRLNTATTRFFKRKNFEKAQENLENRVKQFTEQQRRFKLDKESIKAQQAKSDTTPEQSRAIDFNKDPLNDCSNVNLKKSFDYTSQNVRLAKLKYTQLDFDEVEQPVKTYKLDSDVPNFENNKVNKIRDELGDLVNNGESSSRIDEPIELHNEFDQNQPETAALSEEIANENQHEKNENEFLIQHQDENLETIPEFDNQDAERIWRELREIEEERKRNRANNLGLER